MTAPSHSWPADTNRWAAHATASDDGGRDSIPGWHTTSFPGVIARSKDGAPVAGRLPAAGVHWLADRRAVLTGAWRECCRSTTGSPGSPTSARAARASCPCWVSPTSWGISSVLEYDAAVTGETGEFDVNNRKWIKFRDLPVQSMQFWIQRLVTNLSARLTVYVKVECTVSQKTRPLQLISHNSINPQRSLIIFGTEIPYSILNELR